MIGFDKKDNQQSLSYDYEYDFNWKSNRGLEVNARA